MPNSKHIIPNTNTASKKLSKEYIDHSQMSNTGGGDATSMPYSRSHIYVQIQNTSAKQSEYHARCVLSITTANMAHSRTHISVMTESLCGD